MGGSASRTLRDAFRRFESKFGVKVVASGGGGPMHVWLDPHRLLM